MLSLSFRAAIGALLLLATPGLSTSLRAASDDLIIHPTVPIPTPPCASPYNSSLESSCSRTVVTDRLTNVTIRAYEATGATITFLAASEPGELDYLQALEVAIQRFITYFVPGFNSQRIPVARTVPIVTLRFGTPSDPFNYKWGTGMALPASVYPTSAQAPQPDDPFGLLFYTPFATNPLVAVHHFVTPALPGDADWAAAVGFLTEHIPRGYTAVAGASPVFAIYDGEATTTPRNNEVWMSVVKG